MNYQQVLALIQQFIVANGNNEITANVLRPILEAILAQPNELIGDLGDLQTTDQSNLVSAINEVLDVIHPQIGSVNTKIHPLSLFGIDPDLPELSKVAEAVKLYGPFTASAGQQMVFKTITTVGTQENGDIVTRYYRLIKNMTSIGGGGIGQVIPPAWFMPDGQGNYSNPEAEGIIAELGDIGTADVWTAFNLGNAGEAWDMGIYRFVRATQNTEVKFWAFQGNERFYGGPDMLVEPDIYEAFESDFFLITRQPSAQNEVIYDYDDIDELLIRQAEQLSDRLILVRDASDDPNITFESGETKTQALYKLESTGIKTGNISDYILSATPYGNGGTPLTGAQIKQMYEAEPDTNAFTDSLKSWLEGMTKQFTTALKNSYDSTVNWISTNGSNLLSHLSRTDNPHNVTKAQIGLPNVVDGATIKTVTGDGVSGTATDKVITFPTPSQIGALTSADISDFETTSELNVRDTDNRKRANHTGTQLASTISDFNNAVENNSAVLANTAKVTNATHTGDVTGDVALTIGANKVTNSKLDKMPPKTYKGNTSITNDDPQDITVATLREDLAIDQVDNTSDSDKPVSTAVNAELNKLKYNQLVQPNDFALASTWHNYTIVNEGKICRLDLGVVTYQADYMVFLDNDALTDCQIVITGLTGHSIQVGNYAIENLTTGVDRTLTHMAGNPVTIMRKTGTNKWRFLGGVY